MTIADFINNSEGVYRIALYKDGETTPILYAQNNWSGIVPYLGKEIAHFDFAEYVGNMVQVNFYMKGE